jgi:tetratricopeptide (TPR) repeat protein
MRVFRATKLIMLCFVTLTLTGCLSSSRIELNRAKELLSQKKASEAVALYEKIIERESQKSTIGKESPELIEAALEAAQIQQYELKNFKRALSHLQLIIQQSRSSNQRRTAQQRVAMLYLNDLQDFDRAIAELSKLLTLPMSSAEEIDWRHQLARAYYYKGDYTQALIEIEQQLRLEGLGREDRYKTRLLEANILVAAKDHERASKVMTQMIQDEPERAEQDQIHLMLAVSYEERRDFLQAIAVLESIQDRDPRKAFIEEKIRSLRERQSQQPGARGFRK